MASHCLLDKSLLLFRISRSPHIPPHQLINTRLNNILFNTFVLSPTNLPKHDILGTHKKRDHNHQLYIFIFSPVLAHQLPKNISPLAFSLQFHRIQPLGHGLLLVLQNLLLHFTRRLCSKKSRSNLQLRCQNVQIDRTLARNSLLRV